MSGDETSEENAGLRHAVFMSDLSSSFSLVKCFASFFCSESWMISDRLGRFAKSVCFFYFREKCVTFENFLRANKQLRKKGKVARPCVRAAEPSSAESHQTHESSARCGSVDSATRQKNLPQSTLANLSANPFIQFHFLSAPAN